jgi:hypothetical protein
MLLINLTDFLVLGSAIFGALIIPRFIGRILVSGFTVSRLSFDEKEPTRCCKPTISVDLKFYNGI